jgi:hypothetical protein
MATRRRAVSLLIAASLPWVAGGAGAADGPPSAFAGLAVGSGARVTYSVPNYAVVETPFDSGGAVAQATLESSGLARSFASMPYPGDLAVTAPGTLASFGLTPAGALSYPFYVSADHPSVPSAKVADPSGSFLLEATAAERQTAATSKAVPGHPDAVVSGTEAASSVTRDGAGAVVATADTVSRGLEFAKGALRIASVRSRSVTRLPAGAGASTSEVETVVDGATINDVKVTITAEGISFAGQTAPVPLAATTKAMNDALAQSGLSLQFVSGPDVKGGRAADVVEIRSRHPIPVPGNPEGIFTVRLGGAMTAVLTGDAVGLPLPGIDTPAPGAGSALPDSTTPSASGGAGPGVDAPASSPLLSGGSATGVGGQAGELPGGGAARPGTDESSDSRATPAETAAPVTPGAAVPAPTRTVRVARDLRDETSLIYGVVIAAGLLVLLSALGGRKKGVASPWTIS